MPKTIIARSLKMGLDISASIVTVAFDHDARMRPAALILRKRMADDRGRELNFMEPLTSAPRSRSFGLKGCSLNVLASPPGGVFRPRVLPASASSACPHQCR